MERFPNFSWNDEWRTNKLSVCFLLRRCGAQEACWLENASLFGAIRMGNFWWWTWVLPWAQMGRKDSDSGTAGVRWYSDNTVGGSAREVEEGFSRYPQCHTSMKSYFLFLFSSPPRMAGVRLFSLSLSQAPSLPVPASLVEDGPGHVRTIVSGSCLCYFIWKNRHNSIKIMGKIVSRFKPIAISTKRKS